MKNEFHLQRREQNIVDQWSECSLPPIACKQTLAAIYSARKREVLPKP